MAGQEGQVTTGKKITFLLLGLLASGVYFLYFLDIAAMKIQGLDYCYNFPDWFRALCF